MEEINPLNELNAERIDKQLMRSALWILGIAILAFLAYHLFIKKKQEDNPAAPADS